MKGPWHNSRLSQAPSTQADASGLRQAAERYATAQYADTR